MLGAVTVERNGYRREEEGAGAVTTAGDDRGCRDRARLLVRQADDQEDLFAGSEALTPLEPPTPSLYSNFKLTCPQIGLPVVNALVSSRWRSACSIGCLSARPTENATRKRQYTGR